MSPWSRTFREPRPAPGSRRHISLLSQLRPSRRSTTRRKRISRTPRQRVESQDVEGWAHDPRPKQAPTRAQVVTLYRDAYLPGNAAALDWSGSIAGCSPGATNVEHQQAVIGRVNYYRALVDLPPVSLLTGNQTAQVQAAALMMSAHNALSHTPPATWTCFSAAGATGAMNANIALGVRGVASIDLYMSDAGAGNFAVGHRRWILFPPRTAMTTGDVPGGNQPPRPANALYVLGPQGTRPATPNGIAWPPAGFVPYQNLPAQSNRWSYSFPNANFANATVTMSGPGGAIPIALEALATGFGDNTLVFLPPNGVSYAKPAGDTTYTIAISGITGSGAPAAIEYQVTVIDPDAAAPGPEAVDVVEFYNASLDHYFITWGPARSRISTPDARPRAGRAPARRSGLHVAAGRHVPRLPLSTSRPARATRTSSAAAPPSATRPVSRIRLRARRAELHAPVPAGRRASVRRARSPFYRVFSNRADANHRYMIDAAMRDQMVARGWLAEGDGPNLVVMCAPRRGASGYTSRLRTPSALVSMNARRGSTSSPISVVKISSDAMASSICTLQQPAHGGIHRRFPELLGIHLAQALVALDRDAVARLARAASRAPP